MSGRGPRVKSVEAARSINIHQIAKAAQNADSPILAIRWRESEVGVVLLADELLTVVANGKVYRASVTRREFRKGRFQRQMTCVTCARRCHILYLEDGKLCCRKCAGLRYLCQLGNRKDRAYLKAQKIIAQLGGHPAQVLPDRPARMWRTTYQRLVTQLLLAQRNYFDALLTKSS